MGWGANRPLQSEALLELHLRSLAEPKRKPQPAGKPAWREIRPFQILLQILLHGVCFSHLCLTYLTCWRLISLLPAPYASHFSKLLHTRSPAFAYMESWLPQPPWAGFAEGNGPQEPSSPPGTPPLQKSLPLPEACVGTPTISGHSIQDLRRLWASLSTQAELYITGGADTAPAWPVFPAGAAPRFCPISALCSHIQTPYHMAFLAKWFPFNLWSLSITTGHLLVPVLPRQLPLPVLLRSSTSRNSGLLKLLPDPNRRVLLLLQALVWNTSKGFFSPKERWHSDVPSCLACALVPHPLGDRGGSKFCHPSGVQPRKGGDTSGPPHRNDCSLSAIVCVW